MGERKIDNIDRLGNRDEPRGQGEKGSGLTGGATGEQAAPPQLVEANYPEPTALAVVLKDVAKWSGLSFVMEPSVNVKVQIFAPRRLAAEQAYELFLISLSVVGLRAVQIGNVVKIVPVQHIVSA